MSWNESWHPVFHMTTEKLWRGHLPPRLPPPRVAHTNTHSAYYAEEIINNHPFSSHLKSFSRPHRAVCFRLSPAWHFLFEPPSLYVWLFSFTALFLSLEFHHFGSLRKVVDTSPWTFALFSCRPPSLVTTITAPTSLPKPFCLSILFL